MRFLLIALMLFSACQVNADNGSDPGRKERKLARKAENFFTFEKFSDALPIYTSLADKYPEKFSFNYRAGVCCYYSTNQKIKSIAYFEKAASLSSKDTLFEVFYYLASAYHLAGRFENAILAYQVASRHTPLKEDREDIDFLISSCKNGIELKKNPANVQIMNLGESINTEYPDYAPVISADEDVLIFTSKRKGTTGGKKTPDHFYFEDVFISKKAGQKWHDAEKLDTGANERVGFFKVIFSKPERISKSINTREHDASVSLSADGKKLFIFRDGDIWMAKNISGKWVEPERLFESVNSRKYHEPSVCMSADEQKLYVVSDRPGGYGGKDIYVSEKEKDGKWGSLKNLGPVINTEKDEESPFIHRNGKLFYFSSQGHKTIGGFDIFRSTVSGDTFAAPENIGMPVNTGGDDIFFVINDSLDRGYYSAYRPDSYGELDIYSVNLLLRKRKIMLAIRPLLSFDSEKVESRLRIRTQYADTTYLISRNTEPEIVIEKDSTIEFTVISPGQPEKTLTVTVPESADSLVTLRLNEFREPDESGKLVLKSRIIVAFDTLIEGTVPDLIVAADSNLFRTYEIIQPLKVSDIVFKPVLFDYEKALIRKEDQVVIDEVLSVLNSNKDLKVVVTGHTDSKGDELFNLRLSSKRATAAKTYLVKKGISGNRIRIDGKGEKEPVASNENPDGSDNPEGRKKNRRVVFVLE